MESTVRKRIGVNLAGLRMALDGSPSATEFAPRVGMSPNFYLRIERGLQNLSLSTMSRLAIGMGVDLTALVEGITHAMLVAEGLDALETRRAAGPAARVRGATDGKAASEPDPGGAATLARRDDAVVDVVSSDDAGEAQEG